MISLIQGKILSKKEGELVLMTSGGVGYKLSVSPSAIAQGKVGDVVTIETYLSVKEDALNLFGFASGAEKELFKQFLTVSGVGPKTALHLLALGGVEDITLAIGRGDLDYLTKVSGIGRKTAERIVVELKSKVAKGLKESGIANPEVGAPSDSITDVIDALVTLGYSVLAAREVVKKLNPANKSTEQLLREALTSIR